jgi:hypothetical protein
MSTLTASTYSASRKYYTHAPVSARGLMLALPKAPPQHALLLWIPDLEFPVAASRNPPSWRRDLGGPLARILRDTTGGEKREKALTS